MTVINCAIAIIFNDKNQVLLTERHDPTHPFAHKKWQFPGGKVEQSETPSEACLREVLEETGLVIELLSDEAIRYDHTYDETSYLVKLYGFPAKYITGELDITKEDETSDAKWFNYNDIPFDNVLPYTKELVDDSLKYIRNL